MRQRIPRAMEAEVVAARRVALVEEQEKAAATVVEVLQAELAPDPFVALVGSPDALMVVPARGHEPLERAAYVALSQEAQREVDEHVQAARHRVFAAHRRIHELAREARDLVEDLNGDVARAIVGHRVAAVKEKYAALEGVQAYLDALSEDILAHIDEFMPREEPDGAGKMVLVKAREDFFRRYVVRVLVTHDPSGHAPVVHEVHPTVPNLFGHVERQLELGVLTTDFTQITAGALARANGGYLLLDAGDVLTRPAAWPALMRALQMRRASPAEASDMAFLAMETLDPEPLPLDVKVVLVGEPQLYYGLHGVDHDFAELFKVKSDFAPDVERTSEAERGYADFVASRCEEHHLPPFEAGAVARVIEEGSRRAGDQHRLTALMREIADVITEAAHFARAAGRETVGVEDLDRALAERERRDYRPAREILEMIRRGVLRFEPRGHAAGQLHGIGLLSLGELSFGRPIRVMASAYMGTSGVVDLEREASLSGRIHTKGFLILNGYLGRMFARTQPLVFAGTLSFEQMYEEVEGDSASAAELFALISAIGGVPLHQGIGVTGAVNPEGMILPVGGVTAKVEGFFSACKVVGLTGDQGVLLPRRNIDHLVLRREVRDAVSEGRFHIWAIDHIEEGWPILSGKDAGDEVVPGQFSPGSVHQAVMDQLGVWAEEWKRYGEKMGAGKE
jgi:predicted ATP-dependent protease